MNPAIARPVQAPFTGVIVDAERNNPLRKFALVLGLMLVFLRVSGGNDLLTVLTHVNFKLLYVVGIPAILGTLLCGGIPRTFKGGSPAIYWTAFWVWIVVSCPTSTWVGDSVRKLMIPYLRTNLPLLFVVGGLIYSWDDFRLLMKWCSYGAFASLVLARLFQNPRYSDRFGLDFGTVANPNDFAAHLLFCLPFLYWIVLSSKSIAFRLLALAGIAYGLLVIIQTGSRGGLIGTVAVLLMVLWFGTAKQRIALLVLAPIGFLGVVAVVPHETLVRITSFSSDDEDASQEALESSDSRKYLLRKSIEYTFQKPLFGVGPGQFPNYEGHNNAVIGTHGTFHETHNSFTEASSECGIPGGLFFIAGLLSSLRIVYKVFKKAKARTDSQDIKTATYCVMLSMIGFIVAITFLNFAYFFYEPLIGGMAIGAASAAADTFGQRDANAAPGRVPPEQMPRWRRPPTPAVAAAPPA